MALKVSCLVFALGAVCYDSVEARHTTRVRGGSYEILQEYLYLSNISDPVHHHHEDKHKHSHSHEGSGICSGAPQYGGGYAGGGGQDGSLASAIGFGPLLQGQGPSGLLPPQDGGFMPQRPSIGQGYMPQAQGGGFNGGQGQGMSHRFLPHAGIIAHHSGTTFGLLQGGHSIQGGQGMAPPPPPPPPPPPQQVPPPRPQMQQMQQMPVQSASSGFGIGTGQIAQAIHGLHHGLFNAAAQQTGFIAQSAGYNQVRPREQAPMPAPPPPPPQMKNEQHSRTGGFVPGPPGNFAQTGLGVKIAQQYFL